MAVDYTARKDMTKAFQLVKHWDEVPDSRKQYPYHLEVKYDGVFIALYIRNGLVTTLSRTGKELWEELGRIWDGHDYDDGVYIGELCNDRLSLESLSGLVNPNRVNPWTEHEAGQMVYSYVVFHDHLTLEEFHAGRSERTYGQRRNYLKTHMYDTPEHAMAWNEQDIYAFADSVIAQGHEGIVIKHTVAGYEAGHKGWRSMKIVRGIHVDLKCLAVETGRGKRAGQIARLQFKYKGKEFWADLGKGWTDEKRIALTEMWVRSANVHGPAKAFPIGFVSTLR